MDIVSQENDQNIIKLSVPKRFWIKQEIRKLKTQNKETLKLIKFCNKDFSKFEQAFDEEVLLYEELLEELMCTKDLLNISISKNTEKINNYRNILSCKQ